VAQYHKNVFYIFDSDSFIFDVREALTDEKGEFHISPKISLIQPLSTGGYTLFLIWKPGYKPIEKTDWFFKEEPGAMVKRRVRTDKGFEMKPVRTGIVELERARTREERRIAHPGPVGDDKFYKNQKHFIKMIRKEWESITGKSAGDLYQIKEGK
jgi:hypothetical protein